MPENDVSIALSLSKAILYFSKLEIHTVSLIVCGVAFLLIVLCLALAVKLWTPLLCMTMFALSDKLLL